MTTNKPYPIKKSEKKRIVLQKMWNALSPEGKELVAKKLDRTKGHVGNMVNGFYNPNTDFFIVTYVKVSNAYLDEYEAIRKLLIVCENE